MKKETNDSEKIKDALLKRALGYSADEIIEEYSIDENGESKLAKRKVTKKFIPPDISSAKILLSFFSEYQNEDIENMSEAELIQERNRLLGLLEKENYDVDGEM